MSDGKERFESWCIVELFGHQRVAGLVSEQQIGGCNFVRVDVPAAAGRAAMTKFYGQGAIYCMTPVTETLARRAAGAFAPRPVAEYDLPPALPPPARPAEFRDDPDDSSGDPDEKGGKKNRVPPMDPREPSGLPDGTEGRP